MVRGCAGFASSRADKLTTARPVLGLMSPGKSNCCSGRDSHFSNLQRGVGGWEEMLTHKTVICRPEPHATGCFLKAEVLVHGPDSFYSDLLSRTGREKA